MTAASTAPGLLRRMAAFVYEGVLLFGVLFVPEFLLLKLAHRFEFLQGEAVRNSVLFGVLAVYFTGFWSHGGQTVALKAWHLRIVDRNGNQLSWRRALARYFASWLWFLPALIAIHLTGGLHSWSKLFGGLMAGVLAYVVAARLHPRRQFLHDLICGTQIVDQPARA